MGMVDIFHIRDSKGRYAIHLASLNIPVARSQPGELERELKVSR